MGLSAVLRRLSRRRTRPLDSTTQDQMGDLAARLAEQRGDNITLAQGPGSLGPSGDSIGALADAVADARSMGDIGIGAALEGVPIKSYRKPK